MASKIEFLQNELKRTDNYCRNLIEENRKLREENDWLHKYNNSLSGLIEKYENIQKQFSDWVHHGISK